ncbi:TolC family outer membrane protein [Microbaculum marinum]|uniref:TolC family outer membrane protein n=1 Tax=Microbaculum marinum TaxID=1764581 RepID=A0AAW9RN19_9HYPH
MTANESVRIGWVGAGWRAFALAAAVAAGLYPSIASAETLMSAMASAYTSNPDLNAQRASLRAVDEQVPQALAGWRPQIFATGVVQHTRNYSDPGGSSRYSTTGATLSIVQPLFRGFQTVNSTKSAEANVRSNREVLRNTEQNTLFSAVQAYMDVLTNQAIVELNRQNIEVLDEQLRATRDRFQVGEVTNTDVAQAEAALSGAYTLLNASESDLLSSKAVYRQVIGRDPVNLAPGTPTKSIPTSLDDSIRLAHSDHPAIIASIYAEEAAAYNVKVAEGTLLPTVELQGSVSHFINPNGVLDTQSSGQVGVQVTVPIYQGGFEYSQVRQAKETRTQALLLVDSARQQVRAAVVSAWGSLEAATASITSAQAQVKAAQIALNGVREEAKVGQRTTLDVLDAEQTLLDSKVSLVFAESDRVVASYALQSAVGRLTANYLRLAVQEYQPAQHYEQVRDKWFGLRTPSGQ